MRSVIGGVALAVFCTIAASSSAAQQPDTVSTAQALEDIRQFQHVLDKRSSYAQIATFDYQHALASLAESISRSDHAVSVRMLANELATIMAEVGDRHSKVAIPDNADCATCDLHLPFAMAVQGSEFVALKRASGKQRWKYVDADYPYVKSINAMPVKEFIDQYAVRHKNAPELARWSRGARDLRKIGDRISLVDNKEVKRIDVTLTNGELDKQQSFRLSKTRHSYRSIASVRGDKLHRGLEKGYLSQSSKLLPGNVGYLNIPRMYSSDDAPDFVAHINSVFDEFRQTNALIIDVRDNGGGTRDLLMEVAPHVVPKTHSPWVANIAYLRSDQVVDSDQNSMTGRYLHTMNSAAFNDQDRATIAEFEEGFSPSAAFDASKFSVPFYMVLRSDERPYEQPVYVLVDERVFSAASVFATALKGLPNVKLVGVTTDGSSGNSGRGQATLEHSRIEIRVSTMLSFQRNGKTLDGHGTQPDIEIHADQAQVLWQKDTQLVKLLTLIVSQTGS